MAARMYVNVGSEITPVWVELTSSKSLWFGSDETTETVFKPTIINNNSSEVVNPAVCWLGDFPVYGNGQKVETYVPVNSATQYSKVIRVIFDEDTTTPPKITAWKDDTKTTTDCEALNGTSMTSLTSLIKMIETTLGAPAQNWCANDYAIASPYAQMNALRGNENFLTCADVSSAGGNKDFAIAVWLPADLSVPLLNSRKDFTFNVQYTAMT